MFKFHRSKHPFFEMVPEQKQDYCNHVLNPSRNLSRNRIKEVFSLKTIHVMYLILNYDSEKRKRAILVNMQR